MGKKVVQASLWILSGMILMGIIVWFTTNQGVRTLEIQYDWVRN